MLTAIVAKPVFKMFRMNTSVPMRNTMWGKEPRLKLMCVNFSILGRNLLSLLLVSFGRCGVMGKQLDQLLAGILIVALIRAGSFHIIN